MQQRPKTIRLIRLAMAAAVLLPCALFAFASWTAYRNLHTLADERLLRSLDVQQEEATKTFELINLTMSNASDLVAGMSGGDIRQNGEWLHKQFKKYPDAVAVIQSIWIYGTDGRALVSSSIYPPASQSYADRDFFIAHFKENVGIHYGQVYPSSFNNEPFSTISRRLTREGEFVGVLEASVLPSNFFKFFAALAYTRGLQYALIRGRKLVEEAVQLHPDLKVLYMTGYSRNAIVHQGRLDPGVDLLQKPLSHEQLAAMVRKVLDR